MYVFIHIDLFIYLHMCAYCCPPPGGPFSQCGQTLTRGRQYVYICLNISRSVQEVTYLCVLVLGLMVNPICVRIVAPPVQVDPFLNLVKGQPKGGGLRVCLNISRSVHIVTYLCVLVLGLMINPICVHIVAPPPVQVDPFLNLVKGQPKGGGIHICLIISRSVHIVAYLCVLVLGLMINPICVHIVAPPLYRWIRS